VLSKQVVYGLSHASVPFCSGYFGNWGLANCLLGVASNRDPPDLSLWCPARYLHFGEAEGKGVGEKDLKACSLLKKLFLQTSAFQPDLQLVLSLLCAPY
jgi:hypothetical protein